MPFKSQAQRRKFYALKREGKMTQSKIDEWEKDTPKSLPEKLAMAVKEKQFTINQNWKRQLTRAADYNEKPENNNRVFDIKYKKASTKQLVRRKIEPLRYRADKNLVIAFDQKRGAIRSFNMGRIMEMSKVASGFMKRAGYKLNNIGLPERVFNLYNNG